jgi:hypothetical protein
MRRSSPDISSLSIVSSPGRAFTLFLFACMLGGSLAAQLVRAQDKPAEGDELAKSVVAKADAVRFPQEGFQVDVTVNSKSAEDNEMRKYRVLSKGNENTIVMTLEPIADKGNILLMKGRDLYLFIPSVSQPVRLSLSQRLTGEVSNGDLARANFAGDYTPAVLRTEKIDGTEHYLLELKAVDRGVTYQRVLYWVNKNNFHPYKAEFYSLSDKLLKTCRYEGYKPLLGKQRPTRLVMEDALKKDEVSTLEYDNMKLRELPERVFTKEYLKRLE